MYGETVEVRETVGRITGRIESQLQGYAASEGIPQDKLTKWVGALLLGVSSGEVFRTEDSVRLRSKTTKTSKGSRSVEVHGKLRKASAPKKPNRTIKQYWAAMTPEQRSKEMKKRFLKRKDA